jgi:tetratricopeptide (TPR) repeat protein
MPEQFSQPPAVATRMERAMALHRQGDLDAAEGIYREIIAEVPDHFAALHLSAVAAAQRGRLAEAERLIGQALAIDANHAEALIVRGNVLRQLRRLDAALASYDRALAIRPDDPEALNGRGMVLRQQRRHDEALASYDRALAIRPDYAEALNNRGNALSELRRFDEALASYDRALATRSDYAEALNNRGNVLKQLRRLDEALVSHERALAIRPDYANALSNRGVVLQELGRLDEALASHDQALAIRPDYVEAICNRSIVLRDLGRLDEALASCDHALAITPDHAEALTSRGIVLRELGRLDEALADCDRALAIRPDFPEALNNRGIALQYLGRLDEALASYARAQAIRPDDAAAHCNEGLCRLLAGDFAAGWAKYEWRWRKQPGANEKREFAQPLWLGEQNISGKTVLLHAEQGHGDTIQFCRYATLLAERGARVVLEVQPALKSLLLGLAGVQQVVARGEKLPDFDFHCPLLSLPLACRTTLQTPARVPYLTPTPGLVQSWRARLPATGAPRIGLAWSGNPQHQNDRNRSIVLNRLAPLLDFGGTLVSLQKELREDDRQWLAAHPEVRHFGDDFSDFADTVALISLLDVVILVDTAVAHLAGAMGKPVWILLPAAGVDWRWLLERDDSPWYPSARLFRQRSMGDWDSVIDWIGNELRARFGAQ